MNLYFPKKASKSVNKTVRAVSKHKQGLHIFQILQLINNKFTHILRDRFYLDITVMLYRCQYAATKTGDLLTNVKTDH